MAAAVSVSVVFLIVREMRTGLYEENDAKKRRREKEQLKNNCGLGLS